MEGDGIANTKSETEKIIQHKKWVHYQSEACEACYNVKKNIKTKNYKFKNQPLPT